MPRTTNKAFDILLNNLEKLACGARKYRTNQSIAVSINESELLKIKNELEALRADYLQKEKIARIAYDHFEAKFKLAQKVSANNMRIIKGLFGPKSGELFDFGINPEREKTTKKMIKDLIIQ